MEAASRSCEQILREYPGTPYLHYRYGLILSALAQYPRAEVELREELRITPSSEATYKALAQVLLSQNKHEEAAAVSKKLPELAPHRAEIDSAQTARYALNRGSTGPKASAASNQAVAETPSGSTH
jgi:tetratricopeptide (TPR) repeat protein